MSPQKVKILLADDQVLLLQSLKMAIETLAADMQIVATAKNGDEAVWAAENQEIDVALLDVRMPGVDGLSAAKIIRMRRPKISVIMLTTFEDEALIAQALKVGVHGYLLKNVAPDKLVASIRAVVAGSMVLDPDVADTIAHSMRPPSKTIRLPTWFYELTPRERTLARLLLQGRSNKEIASEINLGEQTVRNYASVLYEKLGVQERRNAIEVLRSIESAWFDESISTR